MKKWQNCQKPKKNRPKYRKTVKNIKNWQKCRNTGKKS